VHPKFFVISNKAGNTFPIDFIFILEHIKKVTREARLASLVVGGGADNLLAVLEKEPLK
jgi:hypothetical protein